MMTPNSPIIKEIVETTKQNLKRFPDMLIPVFFIGNDESFQVIGCEFTTPEQKDRVAEQIRRIANSLNADFILFVAESWTIPSEHVDHFTKNRDKYPEVRLYPHKQEAIMFLLETKAKTYSGAAILSPNRTMGELTWTEPTAMEGRFSGFLTRQNEMEH